MPPKRRNKQHRIINESDYDTDLNLTDTGAASHPKNAAPVSSAPARTNEELNLTVLRRYNPDIQQILSVAQIAKVYVWNTEAGAWDNGGVEGTLFVCQLLPATLPDTSLIVERYCVVILNRKSLDNFSVELTTSLQIELTEEYVIFINEGDGSGEATAHGIWIFSEPEPSSTARAREITGQIILECADRARNSQLLAEASVVNGNERRDGNHAERDGWYEAEQPHYHQQPEHSLTTQAAIPMAGQQINVGNLFGKQAGSQNHQQHYTPPYQQQQEYGQPSPQEQSQFGRPAQSNILLNLFQSARQG